MDKAAKKADATPAGMDEFSAQTFKAMGYDPITPSIVTIFLSFKRLKDGLQPGRLTPEGYATVATLADLADGKIDLKPKE